MSAPTQQMVIEIDDQIAALIAQINGAPDESTVDVIQECQYVLLDSVLGPFGLSREMLADQDGGNITTLHNFEHDVLANGADRERHATWQKAKTENFDRSDYSKDLPKERKEAFASADHVEDAYSGKPLANERTTHRDHVVSGHEIETSSIGQLAQSRERRVETANLDDNKQWTQGGLNCSKSDQDLLVWKDARNAKDPSKTNAEYYGADKSRLDGAYKRARRAVDRAQTTDLLIKQAKEFGVEGGTEAGKLALRQVIGLLMADLVQGVSQDVRAIARLGIQDARQLAVMLEARAAHTMKRLQEKWATYLTEGATAGISGLLSSLATLLINSFITTAKNVVTIIREGLLAIAKSVKAVVMPPPGTTGAEIAQHVLKLLAGVAATAIGITFEETVRKLLESIPFLTPFATILSTTITGIAAGLAGMLVMLAFDKLKAVLAFQKKQVADLHRGQQVALLQMKRTLLAIDAGHRVVRESAEALQARLIDDAETRSHLEAETNRSLDEYNDAVNAFNTLLTKA